MPNPSSPVFTAVLALALSLSGCAEVAPAPTPRADDAKEARADAPATALSRAGESAAALRTALADGDPAATVEAPLAGEPQRSARVEPGQPTELLADPAAGEDDFEGWYRGTSDRRLFQLHFELTAFLAERGEEHPLRAELHWLGQELDRRAGELDRAVTAAPRPVDFAERYAEADLAELAWWSWSTYRDLRAHRKHTGNELELR